MASTARTSSSSASGGLNLLSPVRGSTAVLLVVMLVSVGLGPASVTGRLLPTVKVCNVDEFYEAMTIACSFPPIQTHKRADYEDSVERNNMDLESFSEQCCQKECSIGIFMHLCNKHDLRRK